MRRGVEESRVLMTESLVALSLEELPSCSLNRNWCRYDPCIIVLVDRGRLIRVHQDVEASLRAVISRLF